jgi:cytoskeleton protein RodZ
MIENQVQAGAPGDGQSAGTLMRQGRERAGMHIAALAVALKVPVKRLEALEADRHDLLPGPVFIRALAASVCRCLKLDAAAVLARLPEARQHDLVVEGSLNQPFRTTSHGGNASAWPQVSRPALIAGAALLVAAALVYFLPDLGLFERDAAPAPAPAAMVTEQVAPVARGDAAAPAAPPPQTAAAQATVPAAQAPAPATPAAVTAPAPATAAAPGTDPVVLFNARRSTWVEVIDASGAVLLRRVLDAGEQVPISAAPVLKVTVGNVGGVEVKVRGQAMDLGPLAQNNVARFEVK